LQFEDSAKTKGLVLRQRSVSARVWSDSLVLSRILGNFLSNAIRHTSAGGVLLAVRRRQQFWCFEVWDTGVGIAPEHQSPIFEEFYRVNLHQGTEDSLGLGLTIVSRLSAMMGYELSLASVPGRGSVFRLMVPVTPPLLSR
jgi:signal transduction histidine kinase